jgi:hypothetical protein
MVACVFGLLLPAHAVAAVPGPATPACTLGVLPVAVCGATPEPGPQPQPAPVPGGAPSPPPVAGPTTVASLPSMPVSGVGPPEAPPTSVGAAPATELHRSPALSRAEGPAARARSSRGGVAAFALLVLLGATALAMSRRRETSAHARGVGRFVDVRSTPPVPL